jgi:succinate-semialdehyde dehydrogenase/glutarate-semialdehyde dehydrogenase
VTAVALSLIDGRWETHDGLVDVTNPANGSVAGQLGWGGPQDAVRAADAAATALDAWADLPARAPTSCVRGAT